MPAISGGGPPGTGWYNGYSSEIKYMLKQRTLKSLIRATGVGLHSGVKVNLVLRPAAPHTGVVFRRVDLDPPVDLVTDPNAVVDTRLCSGLARGDVKVATIEHLMSALAGLGVEQRLRERRCTGNPDSRR